jgi:hypothetical protein
MIGEKAFRSLAFKNETRDSTKDQGAARAGLTRIFVFASHSIGESLEEKACA